MSRRSPDPSTYRQLILGLAIPGCITTYVPSSAIIYATDGSSLAFGIVLGAGTMSEHPRWRYDIQSFVTNLLFILEQLSLMVSAGMFFCMALNLQLVLAHGVSGQKMEKYYILGTALVCLMHRHAICGWETRARGPSTAPVDLLDHFRLRGEVSAFVIILGYLIVHTALPTRGHAAQCDPHVGGLAQRREDHPEVPEVILRIGLYPLVACLLNISTANTRLAL
ncbi:hypothetical protein B0H13DRAFT_2508761 [Mycena leptocephala]|nr:hypothetical protein B0H13DRAFT_2508761 [Mycena leptocephala]